MTGHLSLSQTIAFYHRYPCFVKYLAWRPFCRISDVGYDFCLHLGAFFITALVCHGELAKDRPAARHLTDFYLCMSLGGVLGGIFNALIAPQVFWFGVAEYYLAMVLACCARPNNYGVVNWIVGRRDDQTALIPGDSTAEESTPLGWF